MMYWLIILMIKIKDLVWFKAFINIILFIGVWFSLRFVTNAYGSQLVYL